MRNKYFIVNILNSPTLPLKSFNFNKIKIIIYRRKTGIKHSIICGNINSVAFYKYIVNWSSVKNRNKWRFENKVEKENTLVVFEITLSNLRSDGEIDERDFMDRAELLCSLGQTVMISNFQEYYKVVEYFANYTKARMGLAMGVNNLVDIFDEKYYRHLSGGILEAFGKLFYRDMKVFLYPMIGENGEIITSENLKVHPRMKELYKFFKFNGKVIDIKDYEENNLAIFSRKVLKMICSDETGWEEMLPDGTADIIKKEKLFSYACEIDLKGSASNE